MNSTGNELESNDILDFEDNTVNLDILMNADQEYWTDRLGNKRPTIDYALRMAGFTPAGFDFATGGVLKNGDRNKCVFNQADQTWYSYSGDLPYNVIAGSVPGEGWKVVNRNALTIAREALRRTYQEVGLNLVEGSFEQGANITSTTDVVLHEKTGKCYSGPIGQVPKGTNPLSGGFVDKSRESLRIKWVPGQVSSMGTFYTYTSLSGLSIELYDPIGGHILGARPDDNFHAVGEELNVEALDSDLITAIKIAKGKCVVVNTTVTVSNGLADLTHRVYLKGAGRINFTTDKFLSTFTGDFLVSGLHLHSDSPCVVVSYSSDAHVGLFSLVDNTRITGGIKFLYNATRTLNPTTSPHGIDVIWVKNIDTDGTVETVMNFDNAPYKLANIEKNRVRNFSKVFLSLANTNSHPFLSELQRAQVLCTFEGNTVKNDDDWWTTDVNTIVTYGAVLLHEGNTLQYRNNVIEGVKARRQADDAGKSHSTAYWLYMGALNNFVSGNSIKNCFSFGSRDVPNVAFKQKQGTNIQAYDNKITFDGNWLSRLGESISPTNDLHVIHDVEPNWLFEDIDYHDNMIEIVANAQTIFCNSSKYYFHNNIIRRGPTNLPTINIAFPVISYDNATLTTKPVAKYIGNIVTNEGGGVVTPHVRSTRSNQFLDKPLIVVQNNEYMCGLISGFSRVQGKENYIINSSNNTAIVTSYGSIFSDQGVNALATSVSGTGNAIKSIPETLTTQKGFGLIPYGEQLDVSLNVSSEGTITDFILLSGDVVAPTIKYCISGIMKTSTGVKQFSFLFTLTNQSTGVNAVSFIDADGNTARTVLSNSSTSYFCKQEFAGTTTRLNIAGSASRNIISLNISESVEGVITDSSVNYEVNIYGVKQ